MARFHRRNVAVVLAVAASCIVAGAACSLDLDEALIDRRADGGGLEDAPHSSVEAGVETGSPAPTAIPCENDDACKTTNGCLKGKCDLARKTCMFDVCRTMACNASACDQATSTCGAPTPYKYKVVQFPVGVQPRGAVAIYPWLFVLTTTGPVAFNVANIANGSPPQVPISGFGFVPNQMVQSGNRLWFRGGSSGGGPSRFPLAYLDVPSDPFTTTFTVNAVLATYDRAAGEGGTLFSRGDGTALLVGSAEAQFPSTVIEAPFGDPFALTGTVLPAIASTLPVAMSGKRLVMASAAADSFYFIDNVGTKTPTATAPVPTPALGPVGAIRTAGQSTDGAVFFAYGTNVGAPPDVVRTRAARGHFITANETANIDAALGLDIEVYDDPANVVGENGGVLGPVGLLDAKTVMVSVLARENAAATAVEFVSREPISVIKDVDMQPRRQVLPIPVGRVVAVTGSNGIGYLVADDQEGPPRSGTVYVFDPACPR